MARIDLVRTTGMFRLGDVEAEVTNNIWLVGDDDEVAIIDAAHDAVPIVAGVGGRMVTAILCTHGHNDHVNAAVEVAAQVDAPIHLHADDRFLWDMTHPGRAPDRELAHGQTIRVAGAELAVLHTPGHSPGSVSLHDPLGHVVFGGDTLFNGGPGATGIPHADFPTIIDSLQAHLLVLPHETMVKTGHGDTTSIGDEAPHLDEWIARGH
jgi:glyoxylase-like metal-dependent hydrolase (beta-lactamase superfamily II)